MKIPRSSAVPSPFTSGIPESAGLKNTFTSFFVRPSATSP